VTVIVDQDPDRYRLTVQQANAMLRTPDNLRDRAVICLLLCTGVRVEELVNLHRADLYATMDDGALALRVRQGKGSKARKVPYGGLEWVLDVVEAYMDAEGISAGRVFRFAKRTAQRIVARYPVRDGEGWHTVHPHELRYTYARRMYEAGMKPEAIQQNLGHEDLKTTMLYIGELDGDYRQPPPVFAAP